MKWNCDFLSDWFNNHINAREVKWLAREGKWEPVFLLWPRKVAERDCRWLEVVDRASRYTAWYRMDGLKPFFLYMFTPYSYGPVWTYRARDRNYSGLAPA